MTKGKEGVTLSARCDHGLAAEKVPTFLSDVYLNAERWKDTGQNRLTACPQRDRRREGGRMQRRADSERLCVLPAKEEADRACGSVDGSADSRLILCTADECVCLCGGLPERVYEAGEKGNRI